MDSFRGRTIDLQVFLLSITVHLLSFPSFGWRTNGALQLPNTDAAQSAILSLCLLSVLAAEYHVGWANFNCYYRA